MIDGLVVNIKVELHSSIFLIALVAKIFEKVTNATTQLLCLATLNQLLLWKRDDFELPSTM